MGSLIFSVGYPSTFSFLAPAVTTQKKQRTHTHQLLATFISKNLFTVFTVKCSVFTSFIIIIIIILLLSHF